MGILRNFVPSQLARSYKVETAPPERKGLSGISTWNNRKSGVFQKHFQRDAGWMSWMLEKVYYTDPSFYLCGEGDRKGIYVHN